MNKKNREHISNESFLELKNTTWSKEQKERIMARINSSPQKKSRPYKYYFSLSVASILLFLIVPTLFSLYNQQSGELNMDVSFQPIMAELGYDTILLNQEVDNGVVVFYDPALKSADNEKAASELAVIYIKRTLFGWEETFSRGGYSSGVPSDLYSQYISTGDAGSPFPLLFGEVGNHKIKQVKVDVGDKMGEIEAEIVKKEGRVIWFAFVPKKTAEVTYFIKGYSDDGKLISTIEEISNANE